MINAGGGVTLDASTHADFAGIPVSGRSLAATFGLGGDQQFRWMVASWERPSQSSTQRVAWDTAFTSANLYTYTPVSFAATAGAEASLGYGASWLEYALIYTEP